MKTVAPHKEGSLQDDPDTHYCRRQRRSDSDYQQAYQAWVDSLPPEERQQLAAMGLDQPLMSDTAGSGWVEFEFPSPVVLDRVVWSRDRERKFIDRLAVEYDVEVAVEPGRWRTVASSADRERLPALPAGTQPYMAMSGHFAATATELSVDGHSAAGEYLLETWQTSRGLPSNTVTAVTQTRPARVFNTASLPRRTAHGAPRGLDVHLRS